MDWDRAIAALQADKAAHWEWCREYIDHHCILRSPPGTQLMSSINKPNPQVWSFCMQIGTLNPEFGHRIGTLFWDRFLVNYQRNPFQLCGC